MDVTDWIDGYRRAWEGGDTELVLTLFTEDASSDRTRSRSRMSVTMGSARTGTA
jgi:hypothetical protein